MSNINQIREVVKKIAGYNNLGEHLCFFGGAMPYIMTGKDSFREHSDIDILVDSRFMPIIREILKESNLYKPELDSLNFNIDNDYGLKTYIDGVYVEFEPMEIENNFLHRRSFSPKKQLVGEEIIPFVELTDLIVPISVDGIKTYSYSMEYIKAQKEKYSREKDIADINFIDSAGIDPNKYERTKLSFENANTKLQNYSSGQLSSNNTSTKPL